LALVLLAIVPLLGLMLYNAAERRALAVERAQTDALRIARLAASSQAQFIEQARQMLISLADLPEMRIAGLPACNAIFNSLQTQYLQNTPRYANLGLIDASGKVYCSVFPVSGPIDVSGETFFQDAVQTLSFSLGDYEIDQAKGQTVLKAGYPALDFNGGVRLVLFASLDLGWLNQLASQAQLPPGSTFTVTDRQGTILIQHPGDDHPIGQTLDRLILAAIQAQPGGGALEATDADGVPRLVGFSPLSSGTEDTRAATVSIGIPAREAFAEGDAILLRNLAALGLVALLAFGVAWIAGDRFILRPVQALVHATRRLSAGDLGARTGLSRTDQQGEIGQLAQVFDHMAESLERREIERRQAEAALRESEERYRTLARNFPNGAVILFDQDLRYTLADGAGLAESGLSKEMVEGKTIWEVFAPDTCEILEPHYRAALAGRQNVFEILFAGRIYQVNALPVRNESGDIIAGMVMTQDITERKHAYQLLEQRVEERTHELSTLLHVARDVTSTLELEPLLGVILDQLKSVVDYTGASVLIVEGNLVRYGAYRGPAPMEAVLHIQFPLQDSLTRQIITDRQPVIIPDVREESAQTHSSTKLHPERIDGAFSYIRAWLGVPLIVKEKALGVLSLHHSRPGNFSSRHAELALAFASHAAIAMENARLFETGQRRAEQFRAINEVGRHITSILTVDDLLAQTVRLIEDTFKYYFTSVGLIEGDEVVVKYGDPLRLRVGHEGIIGWVAGSGEPSLVPDVSEDARYIASRSATRTRSELAVPIKSRGRIIGVLDVESERPGAFDESDMTVLQSLANQLAVAIENARLYEQAQQLAALEERQKLARELHDSVSQALYGIALGARTARTLLDRDPQSGAVGDLRRTVGEPLDYVLSLSEAGLAEMRALIFELRPESLEMEGLVAALGKQTASLRARYNIEVRTAFSDEPQLALPAKEALYRIAQEALNNVVKHARARQVSVQLETCDGSVRLEIGDNGVGFDTHGEFPGHLGLRSMRERAEKAGGAFYVESAPGQGTRIRVQFPFQGSG
jgi:PAS domain S-box-containing protein